MSKDKIPEGHHDPDYEVDEGDVVDFSPIKQEGIEARKEKDRKLYPIQRLQALPTGRHWKANVEVKVGENIGGIASGQEPGVECIPKGDAIQIVHDYRRAFGRLVLGLEAVERRGGMIDFLPGDVKRGFVRIKFPDSPAFYGETLERVLDLAIKIEGAKDPR